MSLYANLSDKPIYVNVYPNGKLGGAHKSKADADWCCNLEGSKVIYRLVIRKKNND
jgi:hypothetical protein